MRLLRTLLGAGALLTAVAFAAQDVVAQEAPRGPTVISAGGVPGYQDLVISDQPSPFNLQALGHEASAGFRSNGQISWCMNNVGFGQRGNFGCPGGSIQYQRNASGAWANGYFDVALVFAAGPNDMPSVIDPVASGLKGGGYTVNMTTRIIQGSIAGGGDKIWASDRTGRELLNLGVKSTADGTCTDFTKTADGLISAGFQLLPISTCPPTHPPAGWQGRRPIDESVYADLFANNPAFRDDPFAFWRVPADMQRQDKFFGDTQTYGEQNDFYFEALPRYGAVIPGRSGTPTYHGFPLGLNVWFDAFYFALPSIGGAVFWQGTIVNESEKVYGTGITYDSLYIGINYDPLMSSQRSVQYFDPQRSALLHANTGVRCVGKPTPFSVCAQVGAEGFATAGGAGVIVLKSPIGDLRNKHFTNPESPFYDPTHPARGDTITFQHQHMCGFSGCPTATFSRSQRAFYGLMSSQGQHVLDGRTAGELTVAEYFGTFRPEFWPERNAQFNKYVPGVHDNNPVWDWNKDGVPDTIYSDSCGSKGCVTRWWDTLPGGNTMAYGNISFLSVGPVSMAPGDTVPLVVAFIGAGTRPALEGLASNVVDFYSRFYLGPEPAPAPRIVATNVVGGSTRENTITLFLDNTTESWRDPFLSTLNVGAELELNPWLDDSIAAIAANNVVAYHIFKSCNGGNSFTSDGDCDGDPISDPTSKWATFGYAPYASLHPVAGDLPNTWTDNTVISGITYTYVVVTETRGATFNLVRQGEGALVSERIEFAPSLLSALSASSTNPNVATIYVPLSLAGGQEVARAQFTSARTPADVPFTLTVASTAPTGGSFRALFVDSMIVTKVETLDGATVTGTTTTVEGRLLRTATVNNAASRVTIRTFEFSRQGTVPVSGLTTSAATTSGGTRTTVSRGGAGFILLDANNRPLLATTSLTGSAATPGDFIGSPDFPFFTVSFNSATGGTFNSDSSIYFTAEGRPVNAITSPSVQWRTGTGLSTALPRSPFGAYAVTWAGEAYGPSAPFNVRQTTTLQDVVNQSLAARPVASTSATDPSLLEAIRAADPTVPANTELQAYKLPFTVRNTTFGRDVQVVVTGHQRTILLGTANDTVRVSVPGDVWVPGDTMYFVETVTRERQDAAGRTILGADGQPEMETVAAATFKAVIGCAPGVRLSCDPTVGGAQPTGYITIDPGMQQVVSYYLPVRGGQEIAFDIIPARTPQQIVAAGGKYDLSRVTVVPNPYIFANLMEQTTDSRALRFTGLPPEGRIRIYDIAGRFLQQIDYTADDLRGGDLNWNMRTREDLDLAYGLYVFVVESQGQRKSGKFVIIR